MPQPISPAKILEEVGGKLSELLASSPARDVEKNIKALLAGAFSKLDLVSREEFEIQRELLQRTMARLDALEARLAEQDKPGAEGG